MPRCPDDTNWYFTGNSTSAIGEGTQWSIATTSSFEDVIFSGEMVVFGNPETEQEREQRIQRQWAERELKHKEEAEAKAERLLGEVLGEGVLTKYQTKGQISVDSSLFPGRRYGIRRSGVIEVYEDEKVDGKVVCKRGDRLCVHLVEPETNHKDHDWLPPADVVLGKALLVFNDEERLLQVANTF